MTRACQKASLDTADYCLQRLPIPEILTIQLPGLVMTDENMERHLEDTGPHVADFDMKSSCRQGARIFMKANQTSPSEDGEMIGRPFEKEHLNVSVCPVGLFHWKQNHNLAGR